MTVLALYTIIDVHDEEQDVVFVTKILIIYGIDWNSLALIILLVGLTLRLRLWVLLMRRQRLSVNLLRIWQTTAIITD